MLENDNHAEKQDLADWLAACRCEMSRMQQYSHIVLLDVKLNQHISLPSLLFFTTPVHYSLKCQGYNNKICTNKLAFVYCTWETDVYVGEPNTVCSS